MALLSQYYSHVIIFKYTLVDSIPILRDTPQFRLTGHRRFWTSATDTASLKKATIIINNIFA